MITKVLFLMLAGCLLSACCSTGTTVVLIPDAGGKVGQVELATKGGTTLLSKANESAEAPKLDQAPSQAAQLSDKKVHEMFEETLAKEPAAPEHFKFYFASGSSEPLPEATADLAKTKAAIQARNSCDISVIGHSDTVGDNQMNQGISTQRAENIIVALTSIGVAKECMDKRYYGESDLAVPTADNVDEPQNRRVEVEIR